MCCCRAGERRRSYRPSTPRVRRFYPRIAGNPDYTALLDARGLARMQALLDDARARGGRVLSCGVAEPLPANDVQQRQMPPALVLDTRADMRVLREEIFGPILPIVAYDTLDEAIALVNAGERPLALYWFGDDAARTARVLDETTSGGVVVNDTLLHFVHSNLPFGGVGESGWGAYHGEAGFLRLSHLKPVLRQPRWGGGWGWSIRRMGNGCAGCWGGWRGCRGRAAVHGVVVCNALGDRRGAWAEATGWPLPRMSPAWAAGGPGSSFISLQRPPDTLDPGHLASCVVVRRDADGPRRWCALCSEYEGTSPVLKRCRCTKIEFAEVNLNGKGKS